MLSQIAQAYAEATIMSCDCGKVDNYVVSVRRSKSGDGAFRCWFSFAETCNTKTKHVEDRTYKHQPTTYVRFHFEQIEKIMQRFWGDVKRPGIIK